MSDMGNSGGPCNWPTGVCPEDNYGLETALQAAEVEAEAVFILWSFTGQRYGLCEVEFDTPPRCKCINVCVCEDCIIYLPGPVHEIILIEDSGGNPIEDYVQRGNELIRDTPWPVDYSVKYLRGILPPSGATRVVSALAQQLAYARCNPGKCQLPLNMTQRVRQGDTINLNRRRQHEPEYTGIPLIDLWIRAANGVKAPGKVWSPDIDPLVPVKGPTSGS